MTKLQRFIPQTPDPYLRQGGQLGAVKFGHLNALVDAINATVYGDYLQLAGDGPMSTTLRALEDPEGNIANLYLATDKTAISGSLKVGNSDPNTGSAILQVDSTTQGVLFPRMTVAERDAIVSPAIGLLIYNTDDLVLNGWDGTEWTEVGGGGAGLKLLDDVLMTSTLTEVVDKDNTPSVLLLSTERIGISADSTATTQSTAVIQSSTPNASIALVPNGTGAITANIPDGTAVGGNARGQYAVDLQTSRTAADQVAGTHYSTVIGGENNTVAYRSPGADSDAGGSSIIGGQNNCITLNRSFIAGGCNNFVNRQYEADTYEGAIIAARDSSVTRHGYIFGGHTNSAYNGGIVLGGNNNVASNCGVAIGNTATSNSAGISAGSNVTSSGRNLLLGNASNATGTDNLVVGRNVSSSGSCSMAVGGFNSVTASYSVAIGGGFGAGNQVQGTSASILGGSRNIIYGNGDCSVIGGGWYNYLQTPSSFIGGGYKNCLRNSVCDANSFGSVIVGGVGNNQTGGTWDDTTNTFTANPIPQNAGKFSFVGGGRQNVASGSLSSVVGGQSNQASNTRAVVGGGLGNTANGLSSFIGGGVGNTTSGNYSTVAGGNTLTASGNYSAIGGGRVQTASGNTSFIGGGQNNTASGNCSFVGGGNNNLACGIQSLVVGGFGNTAFGCRTAIVGGCSNIACAENSFVGGGRSNCATGSRSAVAAGSSNTASGYASFIGAGRINTASGLDSVTVSGYQNQATGDNSAILGGERNCATACFSNVIGGKSNCAIATYSSVVGGCANRATGYGSFVGGGIGNIACCNANPDFSSNYSAISGGQYNCTLNPNSFIGSGFCNRIASTRAKGMVIGGGCCNLLTQNDQNQHPMVIAGGQCNCIGGAGGVISGGTLNVGGTYNINHTTIGGGRSNTASVTGSTIPGGCSNTASGSNSIVLGGCSNTASGNFSISGGAVNNSTGDYSISLGANGCSTYPGQLSVGALTSYYGIGGGGLMQFSDLLVFDKIGDYTTGSEIILYPGDSTGLLLKPSIPKLWHVTAKYTLYVAGIVDTVDGIAVGDAVFGTAEFGYRNGVFGSPGFVTSTIRDNKVTNNPALNTATFVFTYGTSEEIESKVIAPEFTGGGTLRMRANIKFELVETTQRLGSLT